MTEMTEAPDPREDDNDGVVDGPGEPTEPNGDPAEVGPDGTRYDDDALEEAERKMTGHDDG